MHRGLSAGFSLGSSSSSITTQRQSFRKGNLGIDLNNDTLVRNKLLSFDYSKHHKVRPHHAYTNTKTLWSDVGRQMLTESDLPILQRLKIEEERDKEAETNKKLLHSTRQSSGHHGSDEGITAATKLSSSSSTGSSIVPWDLPEELNTVRKASRKVINSQMLMKTDTRRPSEVRSGLIGLVRACSASINAGTERHGVEQLELGDTHSQLEDVRNVTVQLLACVLLAEGLPVLINDSVVHNLLNQQEPGPVALIQSLIFEHVTHFLAIAESIDIRQLQSDTPEYLRETFKQTWMQAMVYCSYLLTDPLITSAAAAVTEAANASSPAASPPSSDITVALAKLSSVSDAVLATFLTDISARMLNDGSSGEVGTNLNLHELYLFAKTASAFAASTELLDGNEFYDNILSSLQNTVFKEVKTMTTEIETVHLNLKQDGFGNKKRSIVAKDFPIPFYKIRFLVDISRWLSKTISAHYSTQVDPDQQLKAARSAVTARRRHEAAMMKMLSVVPNILLITEGETVLKWMASVDSLHEMGQADRSAFLLLAMRLTALLPQDGANASKYALLERLLEASGTLDDGNATADAKDEINWCKSSIRNTLKGLGAAEKDFAHTNTNTNSTERHELIEERIALIFNCAEAVKFLPIELWRSIALCVMANHQSGGSVEDTVVRLVRMLRSERDYDEGFIAGVDGSGFICTSLKKIAARA